MVKEIVIKEFCFEMEDILSKEFGIYNNSWRIISLGKLREKMSKQIKEISDIIVSKVDWDKEKVRKKLLCVANYCFFLYNKIGISIK